MKLVDDLIDLLSDRDPSLTDALMKTKVLLHKLGRKDLAKWVNAELTGYPGDSQIPDYRHLNGHVKGNVTNGIYTQSKHPLPTLQLKPKTRESFERIPIPDSISAIEELASGEGQLQRPIPLEANHLFNEVLTNGYQVQLAWCDIGQGQLSQILTQVRSRLLDFLLELNEQLDDISDDEGVRKIGASQQTASMFNNAIFGDNVTIMVGNHNHQEIRNKINHGDFDSLANVLRENEVQEEQIEELRVAVAADGEVDHANDQLGPNVRSWIKGMLGRAVDASWQIELGIASNLLTAALMKFYS